MILALDLGTTTGWAWPSSPEPGVWFGTWQLKPTRFESTGMRFVKLHDALNDIRTTLQRTRPLRHVYYEEVHRHAGTAAAHAYGGYLATLQSWCIENAIEYSGVGVGTIKKFWTGKGNADKAAMMSECERRGFAVKDDNEADAIALLHYVMEK